MDSISTTGVDKLASWESESCLKNQRRKNLHIDHGIGDYSNCPSNIRHILLEGLSNKMVMKHTELRHDEKEQQDVSMKRKAGGNSKYTCYILVIIQELIKLLLQRFILSVIQRLSGKTVRLFYSPLFEMPNGERPLYFLLVSCPWRLQNQSVLGYRRTFVLESPCGNILEKQF